jgi:uncharacterized membrane protein
MLAATLYSWLKFFHILMAIVWVGGGIATQVLAIRITRQNDPAKIAMFVGGSSSSARTCSCRRR